VSCTSLGTRKGSRAKSSYQREIGLKRSNRRSFWRTLKKTRPPTTEAGLVFLLGRLDLLLLLNDRLAGFLHHMGDGFQDGGKIGLGTIG
jgi:hypothetical protein